MRRALLLAACAVFGLAVSARPRAAEAGPASAIRSGSEPAQADAKASPAEARKLALARDPATLPRAAAGRWNAFDPKSVTPESVPKEFLEAHAALRASDLPAVVERLLAALEREPDYPPALHQLGVTYFQLQRYGDALACFERYLSVAPARVGDTRGLAHALYSLGRYAEARAHYQRVLQASPSDLEALRGYALSRYRLGDVDGALADLTRVLERDPAHADAWTWKSQLLLDLDKPEDARVAAEKARDLAPWSPRPWFALSAALNDLGREAEARAARERFQLLSRFDQEIRRLEARLELEPGDYAARRDLVSAQAEVGDRRSVRANLARLLAERPDDVPARIFALDVCDRIGDAEAAGLAARDLERVGQESVAAWKRLETWHAARRDRAKQIEAGERWRRATEP